MPADPRRIANGGAYCRLCDIHFPNTAWDAHERTMMHREKYASWDDDNKRRAAEKAAKPPRPRSPFGGLRGEVIDTANALKAEELSHTDVANWLIDLAARLEKTNAR